MLGSAVLGLGCVPLGGLGMSVVAVEVSGRQGVCWPGGTSCSRRCWHVIGFLYPNTDDADDLVPGTSCLLLLISELRKSRGFEGGCTYHEITALWVRKSRRYFVPTRIRIYSRTRSLLLSFSGINTGIHVGTTKDSDLRYQSEVSSRDDACQAWLTVLFCPVLRFHNCVL